MNFLPDESTFNLAFLVIVAVLLLVLLVLLSTILKFISKWIYTLKKTEISGVQKIRQGAQMEANKIVEEARIRSIAIISASEDITRATKDKINKAIDSSSRELLEEYKKSLIEQKKQTTSALNAATKNMEKDLMEEVEDFKTTLHKETVGSQDAVEKKIEAEYSKIKVELEQYKEQQMKNIEYNVYEILHDASKKVLGKALNMEEHQDLVIKSLEEAKKDKTFTRK